MPQPLSVELLEAENRCSDCLVMELAGDLVQPERRGIFRRLSNLAATEQIDLHLTIQFNEQWEVLPLGRIKFGLKGGELRLKLRNGEIPLAAPESGAPLEVSVSKERQEQGSSENQSGVEASLSEGKTGVKATLGAKEVMGTVDKFQFVSGQVTTKGSATEPAWFFEVETGEPVLKGLLKQAKLGTLSVTAKPCRIEATFEISIRDVFVTEAEGLWSPNISRIKRVTIDRLLASWLLKSKLVPHVSRVVLSYG